MEKIFKNASVIIIVLIVVLMFVMLSSGQSDDIEKISLTQLVQEINVG